MRAEDSRGGETNKGGDVWASIPSDHTKYMIDKYSLHSVERGGLDIRGTRTYTKGEVEDQ